MPNETLGETDDGSVVVAATLTEMIDEAMATAARLNAVLERLERAMGQRVEGEP